MKHQSISKTELARNVAMSIDKVRHLVGLWISPRDHKWLHLWFLRQNPAYSLET